ncbi:hypothetical protein [Mesorhizobium wenxiniae]|uniref:Uncharacterized protein n=1 Tax=Mesorhizobium wenxiniae TaxID=2014805 RepID=A0A271KE15_9HYPH|nr:hypothetical protein [Mesorhizobium wenxiniae]PAP94028.1 hypothetical protein CIT31_16815 [Mesorhizobium wenxiniae]
MAEYQKKDMSGTLFRNERKEKDTHPDWAGYIIINGVEYWLNCWEKTGPKGLFFSLAAKPKEERASEIRRGYQGKQADDVDNMRGGNLDDEIPFAPEWR